MTRSISSKFFFLLKSCNSLRLSSFTHSSIKLSKKTVGSSVAMASLYKFKIDCFKESFCLSDDKNSSSLKKSSFVD